MLTFICARVYVYALCSPDPLWTLDRAFSVCYIKNFLLKNFKTKYLTNCKSHDVVTGEGPASRTPCAVLTGRHPHPIPSLCDEQYKYNIRIQEHHEYFSKNTRANEKHTRKLSFVRIRMGQYTKKSVVDHLVNSFEHRQRVTE